MASSSPLHLLGGRVNMVTLWEAARVELREVLQPDTKKVIVWDSALIGPVGIVAEVAFLRQQGVTKMVRLPVPNLTEQYSDAQEYVFVTRPKIQMVELIAEAIRTSSKKQGKMFTVIFVPRKAQHCIQRFEEYNIAEASRNFKFRVAEFHLDLLPLDSDLLSMDINTAFTDLLVDEDPTPVHQAAKAVCRLQAIFGVIPKITGKGKNARMVADLLSRMKHELFSGSAPDRLVPQIDALVLLDRSIDLLTPLSTQLTYEGLIDEIYGINYCCAKFPRQMFSDEVQQVPKTGPPPSGPLSLMLNSEETVFAEMRDLNFRAVGNFLSREAKKVTAAYEERHDAKTVAELKQFVQKLPHMQQTKISLSRHTTVAELIKTITDKKNFLEQIYAEHNLREDDYGDKPNEYIEQCIGKAEPVAKVLRLICMQSVANSGLKPRLLDYYKREILQGYGYQHLQSLHRLEKAGLLRVQEGKSFQTLRRNLRLAVDRVDEMNPKDVSYVFSGYAPLSVRLVELLEKPNGWGAFDEACRLLPGPAFQITQKTGRAQERRKRPTTEHPKVIMVFFLGGCTYAEMAALRFLSQREDAAVDYIVGTTHITNGMALMNSVLEETPLYKPSKIWDNQMDDAPGEAGPGPGHAHPAPAHPTKSRAAN